MIVIGGDNMKIDKKMIEKVLLLDDDSLWKVVKMVIARSNNDSLKRIERPVDMTKLRETLKGLNEVDLEKATEILRKGESNG